MKVFVVLFLGIGLIGCSSKPASSPSQPTSPTNSYIFNGGTIAGFHGNASKKTTTYKFSLIPIAYAQTTSVSLSGTYSGYVNNLGGGAAAGQGDPSLPNPVAFPIYGVGTFDAVCQGGGVGPSFGFLRCPFGTASGSVDAGQALASQATPTTTLAGTLAPAIVTGNGTIGPLVVYAYAVNGTLPVGPSTTSDLVEVWVIRNGQVLSPAAITCSLPVQTATLQLDRCESSSTFAVQDGDNIVATVTLNAADSIGAMSFFLVKT
jgi:hypothetical protein